jgi:hypothetical protein
MPKPRSAVEAVKQQADVSSEAGQLRSLRVLEAKNQQLEGRLKLEQAKRKQAEADLAAVESKVDTLESSRNLFDVRELSKIKSGRGSATAIVCLSDWHLEENVDPRVVNGLNEFDLDIAAKRIDRTWKKSLQMLEFARHLSNIKDMVVWLGGDMINGYIHEENLEGNFLGPAEATVCVQNHIATGLEFLAKEANAKITVVTSYGNHGRSTHKRRISTGYKSSWEMVAYHNLADRFKSDKRFEFKVECGYHNYLDIQGHLCRFHHGDSVKFGGGVGGVHIPLRKKISQWNKSKKASYDFLGHFHQFIDDWSYVVNGSLVGYNAYAVEIGAEFQEATQSFVVIDRQHGKVLAVPIFCQEGK